jgi:NADH-quinone oxidoreductase subunit J
MEFKTVLFYVFSTVMLVAALRVITARNPIHAVLFLVLAFFNAAGLWMLLQAEFLSIALVMVYVGAVMVLFLFVVMMLDIDIARIREGFWNYLPMAGLVGVLMVCEMVLVLSSSYFGVEMFPGQDVEAGSSNTKMLARLLFTDYFFPFELASVVLLVAVIVAIMLTLRKRPGNKAMNPSDQIAVKSRDRVRIVRMASERDAVVAQEK